MPPLPIFLLELLGQLKFDRVDSVKLELSHKKGGGGGGVKKNEREIKKNAWHEKILKEIFFEKEMKKMVPKIF